MNQGNSFDSSVFVDVSAMNSWKSKVEKISVDGTRILKELMGLAESLNDSWQGTSANSFIENYCTFAKDAISTYSNVSNFGDLLQIVVQTMESE